MAAAKKLEVEMVRHISGTLNGDPWPDKGDTVKLDTATAIHMVGAGHCVPVDEDAFAAAVEAATPAEENDEATTENSDQAGADGSDAAPAGTGEGDQAGADTQATPKA